MLFINKINLISDERIFIYKKTLSNFNTKEYQNKHNKCVFIKIIF